MAINYKDINNQVSNAPLTVAEEIYLINAEAYIDILIKKQFKGYDSEIYVPLNVLRFDYDPMNEKSITIHHSRKKMLREKLEAIYKKAGWHGKVHIDDGLDGPSRSGPDYWILKGKL